MNRLGLWGSILFLILSISILQSNGMQQDPPPQELPSAKEEALAEAYQKLQESIKAFLNKNYEAAQEQWKQGKQFLLEEGKDLASKTQKHLQELQRLFEHLEQEIKKGKEGTSETLEETWRQFKELLKKTPLGKEPPEDHLPGVESYPAWQVWVTLVPRVQQAVVHISAARLSEGSFSLPPEEETLDELFQSFFREQGSSPPAAQLSLGSGFLISAEGYILTTDQVIENAEQLFVGVDKQQHVAKIVGRDARSNIALLKITPPLGTRLPFLSLGDSDALRLAEPVMAVGKPFGEDPVITIGVVSSKNHPGGPNAESLIQVATNIQAGMNGGPLVNIRGEVVGINMIMVDWEDTGFAIPINLVKSLLPSLNGERLYSWLGLSVQPLTPVLAQAFKLKEPAGALISEVVPNSLAAQGGLRRGDVIIAFAGKPVSAPEDLIQLLTETNLEKGIPVMVIRQGEKITLEIKGEDTEGEKHSFESGLDLEISGNRKRYSFS